MNEKQLIYTDDGGSEAITYKWEKCIFKGRPLRNTDVGGNASRTDTMKSTLILILTIFGLVISCGTKELPKDLNESIAYFEEHWSSRQLDDFKNKDEKKAITELHMSVGMWIRNNWIHGDRNPQLIRFFDSLNFRHPDDISSTILRSLHRKLNNKDIDLKGQIDYYEAYWKLVFKAFMAMRASKNETIKESFNQDFCVQLEYQLTRTFRNSDSMEFKGLWCDGILMPFVESLLAKKSVNDARKIITKAWLGYDGQEEYEMVINFGQNSLKRYAKGANLSDCLPSVDSTDWIKLDMDRKKIELYFS